MTFSLSVSGAPGRVQALEDLLRILIVVEADAHHPEPIETPEQEGDIIPGDQPPGDSPGLGDRAGSGRRALKSAPIFLFVSVLQPQLAKLLRRLAGIRQPVVEDDLPGPAVALTRFSEFGRDAAEQDAHRRQALLAVDDTDRRYCAGGTRLGKGEEGPAVMRRA